MEVRIQVHKQVDVLRIYDTIRKKVRGDFSFFPFSSVLMPGFEPRTLSANDKHAKPLDHAAAPILKILSNARDVVEISKQNYFVEDYKDRKGHAFSLLLLFFFPYNFF
jgi:hypothetical protein